MALDKRLDECIVAALPPVRVLARSRTTETTIVDAPGLGAVVRKRWWWPRARDRAKGAFRTTVAAKSPARREHEALGRLRTRLAEPFAPQSFGFEDERRGGVLVACTLVLEEIAGARDLASWLAAEKSSRARRRVLGDLAQRTRAMHDAGLTDREMHPRNVLVDPSLRTWKVDCPKQRAGRRARAADDLACLDVGLVRLCTASERAAFFAAYLGREDAAFVGEVVRLRRRHEAKESKRLPVSREP